MNNYLTNMNIRCIEKGFILIEVLVSLVLLGIISTTLFLGIGTAIKISGIMGARQKAQNLAQLQLDWVKQQEGLMTDYGIVPEVENFPGYLLTTQVGIVGIPPSNARDDNIQKIIVKVIYYGQLVTLEGYKTR